MTDEPEKRKSWITQYGCVDFHEPVTLAEAIETQKLFRDLFAEMHKKRTPCNANTK